MEERTRTEVEPKSKEDINGDINGQLGQKQFDISKLLS